MRPQVPGLKRSKACFYHLQGNDSQADLWLAVAWQDFQQVQAAPTPATSPQM